MQQGRITPGEALLRPVTKGGCVRKQRLLIGNVNRIVEGAITRHLRRIGMPFDEAQNKAKGFTGHSGRVGLIVSGTEAGIAPQQIASVARHANFGMERL